MTTQPTSLRITKKQKPSLSKGDPDNKTKNNKGTKGYKDKNWSEWINSWKKRRNEKPELLLKNEICKKELLLIRVSRTSFPITYKITLHGNSLFRHTMNVIWYELTWVWVDLGTSWLWYNILGSSWLGWSWLVYHRCSGLLIGRWSRWLVNNFAHAQN